MRTTQAGGLPAAMGGENQSSAHPGRLRRATSISGRFSISPDSSSADLQTLGRGCSSASASGRSSLSGDPQTEPSEWLAKGDLTKPLLNEVSAALGKEAKGGLPKRDSSPGVPEKGGKGEGKKGSHKAVCSSLLAIVVCLILVLELAGGWFGAIRSTVQTTVLVSISTDHYLTPAGAMQFTRYGPKTKKQDGTLWMDPPSEGYKQCIDSDSVEESTPTASEGYLRVSTNGGLNQMRAAICDMVAVARILNVTLVIPELDKTSYWNDPSDFGDIFDEEHFVRTLSDHVRVVRELPDGLKNVTAFRKAPVSWSQATYYLEEIAPLVAEHKVVHFTLSDSRLGNNGIPDDIQRLRCRANFRALRFSRPIEEMAAKIVARLRENGPYIALHLRYEKDMLAFSGCNFGLTPLEAAELREARYNVSHWKEKEIDSDARRAAGVCPLTPREVGQMLRALGFPRETPVYVAAGEIYGGEERMANLKEMFPNVVTKETLASEDEMEPFEGHSNRMAAIDYLVSVESDVFLPTYDGNMARVVEGHRRFEGHRKTIVPDRAGLVKLFDRYTNGTVDWRHVETEVRRLHRDREGAPLLRRGLPPEEVKKEVTFYANPYPGCICQDDGAKIGVKSRKVQSH